MTDPLQQLSADSVEQPSAAFTERLRLRVEAIEARADKRPVSVPSHWHLAELNLGRFTAPIDSPEMAEFVNALDRINGLADEAPGFIWRMTDADGGPSSFVDVPGSMIR